MKSYHVKVTNATKMKKSMKVFFLVTIPLIALVLYHQKYQLFEIDGNLELVLTLIITCLPAIILGIRLKQISNEEKISFVNNEIITQAEGPIRLSSIVKFKSPSNAKWNEQNSVLITLHTGQEIQFSALNRQFENKKYGQIFEYFSLEFESRMKNVNENSTQ